jgi:hypothetical protein
MTTTIDVTGLPPIFVQKLLSDVAEERKRQEQPLVVSNVESFPTRARIYDESLTPEQRAARFLESIARMQTTDAIIEDDSRSAMELYASRR